MITGIVSDEFRLSPVEFEHAVRRARQEFEAIGIGDGDAVALLLRNDVSFLVAMTALGRSGIYAATLNWQSHPDEVAYVLNDCGARAVLVEDELVERFAGAIPAAMTVYAVGPNGGAPRIAAATAERLSLLDWNQRVSVQSNVEKELRSAKGVIVYTSGTTGKPKGVRRQPFPDRASEAEYAAMLGHVFGIQRSVRTIICAPLHHSGPSAYTRLAVRHLGNDGLIVLHRKFDAEKLLHDIQKYAITHIWMVPTMFHRMLSLSDDVKRSYGLSSLTHIVHSAANCPPTTKKAMIDWLGPVLYEFYGATETGPVTFARPNHALAKPGTVGSILPGITLSIRDDEGNLLPPGAVGEICCVNHSYPDFTYINRETERRELSVEGEIRTGDMGELDDQGFLFIRDRKKDMVIIGGVNVYPAEIETVLVAMPGISDCAVFGLPDHEYGEVLVAAVTLQAGTDADEEAIKAFLGGRLGRLKVPRRVLIMQELPRQDSGKLLKRKLRENLLAASQLGN
jgi:long-chain acyl-CoA synthetase